MDLQRTQQPTQQETWQPLGESLHRGSLERTGSRSIAFAVEQRCRKIFEKAVPVLMAEGGSTDEELNRQLIDYLHNITASLMLECARLVEEIEKLKRSK